MRKRSKGGSLKSRHRAAEGKGTAGGIGKKTKEERRRERREEGTRGGGSGAGGGVGSQWVVRGNISPSCRP